MENIYSFYLIKENNKIKIRSVEKVSDVFFELYEQCIGEIRFLKDSKSILEAYLLADSFHKAIDKMENILNLLNDNFKGDNKNG